MTLWPKPVQGYMRTEAEAESEAEVQRPRRRSLYKDSGSKSFLNPYIGDQEGISFLIPYIGTHSPRVAQNEDVYEGFTISNSLGTPQVAQNEDVYEVFGHFW